MLTLHCATNTLQSLQQAIRRGRCRGGDMSYLFYMAVGRWSWNNAPWNGLFIVARLSFWTLWSAPCASWHSSTGAVVLPVLTGLCGCGGTPHFKSPSATCKCAMSLVSGIFPLILTKPVFWFNVLLSMHKVLFRKLASESHTSSVSIVRVLFEQAITSSTLHTISTAKISLLMLLLETVSQEFGVLGSRA